MIRPYNQNRTVRSHAFQAIFVPVGAMVAMIVGNIVLGMMAIVDARTVDRTGVPPALGVPGGEGVAGAEDRLARGRPRRRTAGLTHRKSHLARHTSVMRIIRGVVWLAGTVCLAAFAQAPVVGDINFYGLRTVSYTHLTLPTKA